MTPIIIYCGNGGTGNYIADIIICILCVILLIVTLWVGFDINYKIKCKLDKIKENKINKKKYKLKQQYRKDAEDLL